MGQASSGSTIIPLFILHGFISFAILQPVWCAGKGGETIACTYNLPDGTTERMNSELAGDDLWMQVWYEISATSYDFQGSEWRLVELKKQDEPDTDKIMRAWNDGNLIDGVCSADVAMRAKWQKAELVVEVSGTFEIITSTDPSNFEAAGGTEFVAEVIRRITHLSVVDVKVQVLTTGKINIDYAIHYEHRSTKSEADRIASGLQDFKTDSFKKAARDVLGGLPDDRREYWTKFVDDTSDIETNISPTMTRHRNCTGDTATINLHLDGETVIGGTGGFVAKVNIMAHWLYTRRAILRQLGNSISEETHNIVFSTASPGGAEHDDKTNLSNKDTIYVSATQKAATINLQLGGKTVIDGTGGFSAKVNIKRSWADTRTAILKQLGNSISEGSYNIVYSTVSRGGAEHDDLTNVNDKDTIYVSATQKPATISLHLGGQPIVDGTGGFVAKVNIQGNWADTKKTILNQLGNSISQRSHNIKYSTVRHGGVKHDGRTNLTSKDTIYVTATQKIFSSSGTDGCDSAQGAKEVTKEGFNKLEIAMIILLSLGVIVAIVVAIIALWRRDSQAKKNRQEQLELFHRSW